VKKIVAFFVISFLFALLISNCSNDAPKEKSGSGSGEKTEGAEQKSAKRGSAIDFTLKGLDGIERTLSMQKGSVVVVDFWATWCPPCKVEIPYLKDIYDIYKDQGVIVWGVGLDNDEKKLSKFAEDFSINYPVLLGNRTVAQQYDVQGIPTTYLFDKNNRIAFKHVGFAAGMEKDFEKEIKQLLNE